MKTLNERTVVVAGGTGNIGTYVVKSLLERGAAVAVPSRSAQKIHELRKYLTQHGGEANLDRLKTFVGDIGDENGARELQEQITNEIGEPDAVVATLGRFVQAPSLLDATVKDLNEVLRGYLTVLWPSNPGKAPVPAWSPSRPPLSRCCSGHWLKSLKTATYAW